MDDALALASVDLGGRPYAAIDPMLQRPAGDLEQGCLAEFLNGLARGGMLCAHIRVLAASDPHHTAEAAFKALACALERATSPCGGAGPPSVKGTLDGPGAGAGP